MVRVRVRVWICIWILQKNKTHKENIEKSLIDVDTSDTCYACGQAIDNTKTIELHSGLTTDLCETIYKIEATIEELKYAKDNTSIHEKELSDYWESHDNKKRFELLSSGIDDTLSKEYPNFTNLEISLQTLINIYKLYLSNTIC